VFEGWTLVTGIDQHGMGRGLGGGKDGFEIWSKGDQMADSDERMRTVTSAANGGNNWLEINDAGGSQFQTLGIARQVTTQKGASYSLEFDLAGRLGFDGDTTRIAVYVDDVKIGSFDNTSPDAALNWQHAVAKFVGKGGTQTITIVTDASDRYKNGRGMMLDNIALNQSIALNQGKQGGNILLQGVKASLNDTDGSEQLKLSVAGLPEGTVISDGVNTATVTAQQPVADITGWNSALLGIKPPATFSGTLNLQVNATAVEGSNGSQATVSRSITVNVDAVAQAPQLSLQASVNTVSRTIVDTSWENVCDATYGATVVHSNQLGGWEVVDAGCNKDEVFFVWAEGDLMPNGLGKNVTVHAAAGDGREWLGLTNAMPGNGYYQSLGVERDVPTIDGANYTFTFDYAGALGLTAANTRVGVYVDGVQVGSYAGTSGNDALNWQALSFTFKGNGKLRSLRVQLEGGTDTSTLKSAMIDDMKLVETLPSRDNLAYGLAGGSVYLPVIGSKLAEGDVDATLKTELTGIVCGSVLSDGVRSVTVGSNGVVDISSWNMAALVLTPPRGFVGDMSLQVRATSMETSNGSMASATRDIAAHVLDGGFACATPLEMNPFVSYFTDTAASFAVQRGKIVTQASAESLADWMSRMSETLAVVIENKVMNILR